MTQKRPVKRPLLLIGGGADDVDVRYASGFSAPDPFLYVEKGGERHVVVSMLELGRAKACGKTLRTHTVDSLGLKGANRRTLGDQAVALLHLLKVQRLLVSGRCPVGLVRQLEKAGLTVQIKKDPVFPDRLVKSAEEIKALRASQRATVAAMKAARKLIADTRAGADGILLTPDGNHLTSERVRHRIEQVLMEAGCRADETIVAGGDQAVDPHERGFGPLFAGELIVVDIFPCSKISGYWGDMTRTVLKGTPRPDQRRLVQTVLKAQREALSRVKPGMTGKEIHRGICDWFSRAGYETGLMDGIPQGFIHSTGHGVGLDIHEAPSVGPCGGELEAGQVITIEPGLYYRGIGGVRVEDTVVVTESGCSLLARCGKEWIL
ncbi:MAG: Xaa-Pro peptidase family protein [Kiritimatiellia bacterium]